MKHWCLTFCIVVAALFVSINSALSETRKLSSGLPTCQENPVKDKDLINNSEVKKSIKVAEKLMKGQGRILVRKSGTESKIRVMGESKNKKLLNKCINIITKKIK